MHTFAAIMNTYIIRMTVLASWCFTVLTTGSAQRVLDYAIVPQFYNDLELDGFSITLTFQGDADGDTQLLLPDQYHHVKGLYRNVKYLRVQGDKAILLTDKRDSSVVRVRHSPGTLLTITYSLVQGRSHTELSAQNWGAPYIKPDYFQVLGAALFIVPTSVEGYQVTLRWTGVPQNWSLHSSYELSRSLTQSWSAPDARWLESVFAGGMGWQQQHIRHNGHTIKIVSRDDTSSLDKKVIISELTDAMTCLQSYWQDSSMHDYTVVLSRTTNLLPDSMSLSQPMGMNLQHAFWMLLPAQDTTPIDELRHVLYHELTHHWVGGQIRASTDPEDYSMTWWTEGFTEYLTVDAQWRCGVLDTAGYYWAIQQRGLNPLWQSSMREVPQARLAAGFEASAAMRDLVYARGMVLAWYFDMKIRRKNQGKTTLADVMRDCLAHYGARPDGSAGPVLRADMGYFNAQLSTASGLDASSVIRRHITEGRLPEIVPLDLTPNWHVEMQDGIPWIVKR
jgi:predicted metalloprotease with PDZ domain